MQLGWIDFSKEDRQKALDVINLLSEQGAVDELGIGIVRDAFANYFFPGTSTIQTRAKYFLIVPYILRDAVDGRYGKDVNRILRAIDTEEKECGIKLLESNPKAEGVIGTRVLPKGWVARKPSDIYWNGIRTYGIFCDYGLSIPEYVSLAMKLNTQKSSAKLGNRNDEAEENEKDDSDAGDIMNVNFWNLPIYYDNWRDNLTIELTNEEALYLDKQIQKGAKGSLLEYVLKNRIDMNKYEDFVSMAADLSEKVEEKLSYMMKLACEFNNLVYMARVRFNVMLSEEENEVAVSEWDRLKPQVKRRANVDLSAVFNKLELHNPGTYLFLSKLQEAFKALDIDAKNKHCLERLESIKKHKEKIEVSFVDSYLNSKDCIDFFLHQLKFYKGIPTDIYEKINIVSVNEKYYQFRICSYDISGSFTATAIDIFDDGKPWNGRYKASQKNKVYCQ